MPKKAIFGLSLSRLFKSRFGVLVETPTRSFEHQSGDFGYVEPGICRRCQRINFSAIFNPAQSVSQFDGLFIMALHQLQVDASCPICRLFDAVGPNRRFRTQLGYHLRVLSCADIFKPEDLAEDPCPPLALAIFPGRTFDLLSVREYVERNVLLTGKIGMGTTKQGPTIEGSSVQAFVADYSLLSSWLEECDSLHFRACNTKAETRPLSIPLSYIDCLSRAVVQIGKTEEYIALSYVWGSSVSTPRNNTLEEIITLPSKGITQVIEDAIVVVCGLGKRYLWVDQYCIDQGNHDIKNVQIREMDLVYANAYATIVASAGSDADYGLPGISRARGALSVTTNNIELHPSYLPLAYAIKDTAWNTRGWTYQEAILSRQCLFFTDQQIHFVCPETTCCEAVRVNRKNVLMIGPRLITINPKTSWNGVHGSPDRSSIHHLLQHIPSYSGRALTYEKDALDAFRGLLSQAPFYTYYGLPMTPNDYIHDLRTVESANIGFVRGLSWCPAWKPLEGKTINLTRRPEFPSWSWVGWNGKASFYDAYWYMHEKRSDTQFWAEDVNGQAFSLHELAASLTGTKMIQELSPILIVEARVFRLRFQKDRGILGSCICHCGHDASLRAEFPRRERALFFENPIETSEFFQRIEKEAWDCILLCESDFGERSLMIIDWVGSVASQVGFARIGDGRNNLNGLPSERRRIRVA